jgi:hypothetical protein
MKEFTVFGRRYFVDTHGNVMKDAGKMMSKICGREYPYVEFRKKKNGKITRRRIFIHRLVAELYLPNPDNLPQVNHIDGNKNNSEITNLEWVSAGEHQVHSRYVLGNETGWSDTPVVCVETGKVYKSTRDAWRDTKAGYSHISECASGKRKTAGGYHWRYI